MNILHAFSINNVGLLHYVGTALIVTVLVVTIRRLFFDPLAKIPGPWYAKWTDVVLKIKSLSATGPIYVDKLHEKYGPMVRLGPSQVGVTDISAAKKIHTVKGDYVKTDYYLGLGYRKENVINTQDPETHRRHRKLLSQPISERSLKAMEPQIEEKIRLTIKRMGEEMKTRGAADVYKWWMFMATDTIGQLTFGESFHMLERGEVNTEIKDIQLIGAVSSIGTQLKAVMPILYHIRLPGFTDSLKTMSDRQSTSAIAKLQKLGEEMESKDQLLFTKLVKGLTMEGESLTGTELVYNAEGYIAAGSDTTSNTLTYSTWALCRNPELRDQLVKELENLPADFTDEHLKALPYLNHVIQEALRRFPVIPNGLPRYVPKEGAELGGYWLPGRTTVMTQAWSMHRNPEVFPNPDEFNPARWENPTKEMKDSMMAFGGGTRICLGMHLAYIELRLGLAHFFRTFPRARVSTLEGMKDDDMIQALHVVASPQSHRCLIEVL
ncbi:cytochrome P450 [Xylaria bambusicola]|uniref:cytochrome P450 n=1 Tax=Xylaria bambusicola TaxID=326684 RepID=UPI002008DFB1|nr:cytochrome P450 [Xylaria bambusicola]KAI0506385.1 cytochrome P450 [Xylaria bambusicola]